MTSKKNKLLSVKTLLLFIYCCILVFGSVYSYKRMAYNWDMLPYMAVILYYDHVDLKTAHEKVYAAAKEQATEKSYKLLSDTTNPYRKRAIRDANFFIQQMSFRVVKPLYTSLTYLFYKAGASLTKATILPCTICYFFIGLLIFFWLQKYTPIGFAFAGGLTIMFSGPVFSIAFLSTPDALSALLILLGVFFLIEKRSLSILFIFLFLSVFTRIDNVIPAILILTAARFTKNQDLKFKTVTFVALCAAIVLAYFVITANAKPFGSDALFYSTLAKQLNNGFNVSSTFIFRDYISLVKSQFMTGVFFSFISLFVFLTLLLAWGKPFFNFSRLTIEQTLPIIFLIAIAARFILDPEIVERIYVPYYVSILLLLVKKYSFTVNELKLHKQ